MLPTGLECALLNLEGTGNPHQDVYNPLHRTLDIGGEDAYWVGWMKVSGQGYYYMIQVPTLRGWAEATNDPPELAFDRVCMMWLEPAAMKDAPWRAVVS